MDENSRPSARSAPAREGGPPPRTGTAPEHTVVDECAAESAGSLVPVSSLVGYMNRRNG